MASQSSEWKFRVWIRLALWLILIALLSTNSFSADSSALALQALHLPQSLVGNMSLAEQNYVLRKLMHVLVYGILALVSVSAFRQVLTRRRAAWAVCLAVAVCLFTATADEVHQAFLASRTGEIDDVALDVCAAALAATIAASAATRKELPSL